jgi:hypothetical protein
MADQNTDADAKLQKLGQRLRAGYAKQHPAKNLEAVRGAVREQYEQEQTAGRQIKPAPDTGKDQSKKPPERGFEP